MGPFVEQGAIQPFDSAVGLRTVGPGLLVGDPGGCQGVAPGMGLVAGTVVGEDAFNGDPARGEEGLGPLPEPGGGFLLLVGEDLAAGEAGVVVDDRVDLAVVGPGPGLPARLAAECFVAAAVGDVAELLDVHVHQFTGPVAFVAAYGAAGCPAEVGQAGQAEAGQHAVDGRGDQAEQVGDAGRSPPPQDPNLDDPSFGPRRGPAWAGVRTP